MCHRLSWIEIHKGETILGPLTTYDLFDTPQGKSVRRQIIEEDWPGHAAIKMFYGYPPNHNLGTDCECTDFTEPSNFPSQIAEQIKAGTFRDVIDQRLLTSEAWETWLSRHPQYKALLDNYHEAGRLWGEVVLSNVNVESIEALDTVGVVDAAWDDYLDAAWDDYLDARSTFENAFRSFVDDDAHKDFWKVFQDPANRSAAWR